MTNAMDPDLQKVLDSLPPRPPRSRLDPYSELIVEMRRLKWPYRDIARVLAEKCQIKVSTSNVHHFLKMRAVVSRENKRLAAPKIVEACPAARTSESLASDVREQITALRQRSFETPALSPRFEYDASEALRLRNPSDRGSKTGQ